MIVNTQPTVAGYVPRDKQVVEPLCHNRMISHLDHHHHNHWQDMSGH
jgi:hypothetical protein